jgi:hypothetical protein
MTRALGVVLCGLLAVALPAIPITIAACALTGAPLPDIRLPSTPTEVGLAVQLAGVALTLLRWRRPEA